MFTFGGASNLQRRATCPILFYSRRIGLERGLAVPIRGGGRLTGRVGRYTLGLINIQTGDERAAAAQPTNFSVVRVRRDILRRSSVGLLLTGRTASGSGLQDNVAYGVDGTFGFFQNLSINTYWAQTEDHLRTTPAGRGDRASYRGQLDYNGDRYGLQLERLAVGDAFNPGVGYVRRRRHAPQLRPGAVLAAAAAQQRDPEVLLDRVDRLRRERRADGSKRASTRRSSASTSRTPTGSPPPTPTPMSSCRGRSRSRATSRCRSAATTSTPSAWRSTAPTGSASRAT